jgi:hypothetical protein
MIRKTGRYIWNLLRNVSHNLYLQNRYAYALHRIKRYVLYRGMTHYQHLTLVLSFYYEVLWKGRTPILVYQMARVGSQSLYASLRACGLRHTYHLHVISPGNLSIIFPKTMRTARMRSVFSDLQREAQTLGNLLSRQVGGGRRRAQILTPIRDPIARNVSLFFHMLWVSGCSLGRYSVEDLADLFLEDMQHEIALTWFDRELRPSLGIDVYAYPFDKDAGYTTIVSSGIKILLFQVELADSVKERIIANFLGLERFKLLHRHDARQTPYAEKYTQFLQHVRLPSAYVETMCQSRYMRHFYSQAQRARIRARWLCMR